MSIFIKSIKSQFFQIELILVIKYKGVSLSDLKDLFILIFCPLLLLSLLLLSLLNIRIYKRLNIFFYII
jgi:hypothetical protein